MLKKTYDTDIPLDFSLRQSELVSIFQTRISFLVFKGKKVSITIVGIEQCHAKNKFWQMPLSGCWWWGECVFAIKESAL